MSSHLSSHKQLLQLCHIKISIYYAHEILLFKEKKQPEVRMLYTCATVQLLLDVFENRDILCIKKLFAITFFILICLLYLQAEQLFETILYSAE